MSLQKLENYNNKEVIKEEVTILRESLYREIEETNHGLRIIR